MATDIFDEIAESPASADVAEKDIFDEIQPQQFFPSNATIKPPPSVMIPAQGEQSTTYGGPRKPVASYAETLGSVQEAETPAMRFAGPRTSPTEPRIALPNVPIRPEAGFLEAAGREAINAVKGVPEFFTSDLGVASALVSKLAPRLVAAGFSADLAKSAFQQAKQSYQNWDKMTPADKGKATVDVLASLTFGGLTGAHAAGVKLPSLRRSVEAPVQGPPAMGSMLRRPPVAVPSAETQVLESVKANAPEIDVEDNFTEPNQAALDAARAALLELQRAGQQRPVVRPPVAEPPTVPPATSQRPPLPSPVAPPAAEQAALRAELDAELGNEPPPPAASPVPVPPPPNPPAPAGSAVVPADIAAKAGVRLKGVWAPPVPGETGMWEFMLTEPGRESVSFNTKAGATLEEVQAAKARKIAEYDQAPKPAAPPAPAAEPTPAPAAATSGAPVGTKIGRGAVVWEKKEDGWYSRESDGTLVRRPKADVWAEKQLKKPEKGVRVVKPTPEPSTAAPPTSSVGLSAPVDVTQPPKPKRPYNMAALRAPANEFKKLVMENGEQQGWIKRPDFVHPGATGYAAIAHNTEMTAAYKRALEAIGIKTDRNTLKLHAEALPKLKAYLESHAKLEPVALENMGEGSEFTIAGEKFKVGKTNPDTGKVTIEDGIRMKVDAGGVVKIDPGSLKAVELSTDFVPEPETKVPKLRPGEKGTADLLQGPEAPFNLAGEVQGDPARIAADKVAAEKFKAEAAALAAKQQQDLFGAKPASPTGAAPEKGIADDWTSATEETTAEILPQKPGTLPGTAPMVNPPKGPTNELHAGIPLPKYENRKMSPLDKVTASHSAKLQKSFDESRRAQRDIRKAMPSDARQSAASIYREAGGDMAKLNDWETRAKQKWMRDAAHDAQTLTPDEIAIVRRTEAAFAKLEARGNRFDVLQSHRDNYIPHVWDVARPGTGWGGRMLQQRFRFSKARTFDTFFDGDQAGFKPKTLAIGKLLPAYIHEMNKVIADRQAVRDIVAGTNPDGSPMAVPRGTAQVVDGDKGQAVLVQPRAMKEADTRDYKEMSDQPALANWTWASKDTDGNPVFIKSNLALHPDAYRRVNAMLGQSALRQWYRDPVTGLAQIPRAVVRGLDTAQAAMKREMFGLLAPFHQVQEGTHGIGHLVNPFSHIPKVDLRDPAQLDAAKHGLMLLPDRASASMYLEGVGSKSSLVSQGIRKAGPAGRAVADVIDGYQDYLFHQYIPGLKFKTYQAMMGRNMKTYSAELASGEMTPADVKIISAEQANAAYGHLNYALLDRNPTIQHLIQLSALAPDFLEARVRFVGQAIKGLSSKVGHEQFKAIAILAAVQASAAYILSNVTGGEYDPKHPFEVIHNGRRYSMRSVPEDIYGLLKDTRQFAYSRVNPLTVKGGIQLATGLNYRGEKVSALDTFEELLAGYIPITARQIPGIRSLTETSRQNPVSPLQQLAGSLGLRISRYSPVSETYKLAGAWMDKNNIPRAKGSYPISKYQQFRYALEDGDLDRAKTEYDGLLKTMPAHKVALGFKESISHPFTGKKSTDEAFRNSLSGYDKQLYYQANITRQNILKAFYKVQRMKTTGAATPALPQF